MKVTVWTVVGALFLIFIIFRIWDTGIDFYIWLARDGEHLIDMMVVIGIACGIVGIFRNRQPKEKRQ